MANRVVLWQMCETVIAIAVAMQCNAVESLWTASATSPIAYQQLQCLPLRSQETGLVTAGVVLMRMLPGQGSRLGTWHFLLSPPH